MIGKRIVEIRNSKVSYRFELERKITIIKGKSGNGKSTLYNMFDDLMSSKRGNSGIHCSCKDSIVVLRNETDWKSVLDDSNKIVVADEYIEYMYDRDFLNKLQNSDNYFLLITRSSRLASLAYSIDSIFELSTSSSPDGVFVTSFIKRYNDTSLNMSFVPDVVVTEDSNAGFTMFSSVFSCDVVAAKGKDKVYKTIECLKRQGYSSVYAIVDGAGFGNCVGNILTRFGGRADFALFAPESFEYMLLKSRCFKGHITTELTETYNFCDSAIHTTWERYYTWLTEQLCMNKLGISYSKDHLGKYFRTDAVKSDIKAQFSDLSNFVFSNGVDES